MTDPRRDIARLYQIECWPTTIVVGPDGTVRHVQIGSSGQVDAARAS